MRFSNYYNHEGRNRNIYSRNNLLGMTMKELLERELELAYQYNTIGIPADEELMNSEFAHQYQDENGFSHWQAGEKMPDNLVQQAEVQPQTTNQSKPVTNPQSAMQEMDKGNLSTQNLLQQPLNTISESISPKNGQLQCFESGINGFAQQKKSTEFPNLGTFAPNNEKHFMVDFQSDLNKIMQQKEKSPEEQAKQNLQKYVPLEDAGYTDEPYLTYEDLIGDETEEEKLAREQKEIETFDKLFEEELNKNDKTQNAEPYLTYEELLGLEPQSENAKEVPPTEEMLRKQMEENGVPTGGASGIQENWDKNGKIYYTDENGRKINPNLLEKVKYGAEDSVNAFKEYLNRDFDKDAPMNFEEKAVQKVIESGLNKTLPMSSNATLNGMHNMKASRKEKDVIVHENLTSLENSKTKDILKKLGAKDTDKGTIYNFNSEVSQSFKNSPELEAYLTNIRDDVIKGKPLKDSSLYYGFDFKDLLNGNFEKIDRHNMARKITLLNPHVDENGIFTCDLVDYSNFADEPVKNIPTFFNRWGYKMQEKGLYNNHYQIIKIRKKVNW